MNATQPGRLPLAGRQIVITRARHQTPPLEALIHEFGGLPIVYPCIAIESASDTGPLDRALRRIDDFEWLVLTSSNTVLAIEDRLRALEISPEWPRLKIAAAGSGTAAALQSGLGVAADFVPREFGAAALAEQLPLGGRILLPQSDAADPAAAQTLRARGALVTTCTAYRTTCGRGGVDLPAMLGSGCIAALTFASPSAVSCFRRRCPAPSALMLPAACIGPATARAAFEHAFREVVPARKATLRAMLDALADYFTATAAPG